MDMDMDMDMGMGMDMGVGTSLNHSLALDYWYLFAGVVGLLIVIRGVNYYDARQRLKLCHDPSIQNPSRPYGWFSQAWATSTAILREVGLPQLYVPIRGLRWATPPPLGRILILLGYWIIIAFFMSWRSVVMDLNFYQRIGYRNAWVSITQLPMLYLLSTKVNPLGFLVGVGHERINWMHRWVARTMLITATVHGFHFWSMYKEAGLLYMVMEVMPLSKYGFGAWGILLWNTITGFLPLRRLYYEVWVAQHVLSAVAMLWLLYQHIPENARYNLWMAISFLVYDRIARWVILLWQNVRLTKPDTSCCSGMQRIGHQISARAVGPDTTVINIKDNHFKWTAGQHIYLWVPRLGPFEAHPYTVACAQHLKGTCCCNSIQLIVRAHKGFSKRIHNFATKHPEESLTGFLSGPYGVPPRWDIYETMVLIGASTGASFTIPILEKIAFSEGKMCATNVEVVLLSRTVSGIEYYVQRAREAGKAARDKGINVRLHVAITGEGQDGTTTLALPQSTTASSSGASISSDDEDAIKPAEKLSPCCCCAGTSKDKIEAAEIEPVEPRDLTIEKEKAAAVEHETYCKSSGDSISATPEYIREYTTRPDIEALIRQPVEEAWGETAVIVCGGAEVVARTRNCVSRLSDERAVHKGTGAQGIYLHVEEYAF